MMMSMKAMVTPMAMRHPRATPGPRRRLARGDMAEASGVTEMAGMEVLVGGSGAMVDAEAGGASGISGVVEFAGVSGADWATVVAVASVGAPAGARAKAPAAARVGVAAGCGVARPSRVARRGARGVVRARGAGVRSRSATT